MTKEEWLTAVEDASGMSREQLRALGPWAEEGFCRRQECKGWHFVTSATLQAGPRFPLDRDT